MQQVKEPLLQKYKELLAKRYFEAESAEQIMFTTLQNHPSYYWAKLWEIFYEARVEAQKAWLRGEPSN